MITELAPSAPWRVTGELIGGVNVRLSWRAPRQYSLFVTAYLVFYASTSEVSSTNTPAIVCTVFLLHSLLT